MLSDDLLLQLEAAGVSRDARLLYCEGLVYCATALTDGEIRVRLARFSDADDVEACADELVGAGLWHRDGEVYRVDDYLDHQQSASEVERKRAYARQRADRSRRHRRGDHSLCTSKRYCPDAPVSDASRVTHAHVTRDVRTPIQSNPIRIGLDKESAGALAPQGATTPAQTAKSPNHDALVARLIQENDGVADDLHLTDGVTKSGQAFTQVQLMLPGMVVSDEGRLHYVIQCDVTDDLRQAVECVEYLTSVRLDSSQQVSIALDGLTLNEASRLIYNADSSIDLILQEPDNWRAEFGVSTGGGAQ